MVLASTRVMFEQEGCLPYGIVAVRPSLHPYLHSSGFSSFVRRSASVRHYNTTIDWSSPDSAKIRSLTCRKLNNCLLLLFCYHDHYRLNKQHEFVFGVSICDVFLIVSSPALPLFLLLFSSRATPQQCRDVTIIICFILLWL